MTEKVNLATHSHSYVSQINDAYEVLGQSVNQLLLLVVRGSLF